jgi:SSS family solute:Na+ symporter
MFEAIIDSGNAAMLQAPGLLPDGTPWNWWGFSSAVLVSAIGFSVWPHFFMRSFAAKNERSLRLSLVLYPSFLLFIVPILLIGFAAVVMYPGVEPADSILPYVLMRLELPAVIVGLFCAGTLAASMSSGDAILHSAASIGVRDGIAKVGRGQTSMSDTGERRLIRIFVLLIGFVAYYFAVFSEISLVALLLASFGGVAQIFPIVFAMFYWKRATRAGALSGLIGGIIINVLFLIYPEWKPLPLHEGMYGLLINVILLTSVSYFTQPSSQDDIEKFTAS